MGDYLIVSRGPASAASARADTLRSQAITAGMTVSDLGDRAWLAVEGPSPPATLLVGAWRLIGQVFHREHRIVRPDTDQEPWSYERKLLARFWGRFVGVRLSGEGEVAEILRDPCGGLDCIAWEDDGLTIVASAVPGWLPVPRSWSIAFDRVAQALHDPLLVWEDLLLDGPVAILPGTVQPAPLKTLPTALWTPAAIVRRGATQPVSDAEAAAALTLALDDAVRALALDSGPLAAEVSGGLDSSLVAASLIRARKDVAPWINLYGAEAQSDERPYATALGAALGIDIVSVPHASGPLNEADFESISLGVRPGLAGIDMHHDRDWAGRLHAAGATAIMTGRGGDSILLQGATADVFTDLWRARGRRALTSPALPGLARLNDRSIWSLIAGARRPTEARPARRNEMITPIGRPTIPHWLGDCADLGPAKILQIAGLIDGIGRQSPSLQSRVVNVLTPLLSQPVVETCLALPATQLVLGQRDRGLARSAFRDRLPPIITERRTKGEMSAIYGRMVADNLDFLRPWLLEGRLAEAGLINRAAAETMLSRDNLIWRGTYGEIMTAAAVEGWVRAWSRRLSSR